MPQLAIKQQRKQRAVHQLPAPTVCYTPSEFCDAHRLSKSALYGLWKAGRGPRFIVNGVRRIITAEAAAAWRARMESESAR